MTNAEALKALYIKLGGQEEDIPEGATNADLIELVTTKASSGDGPK